MRYVFKWHGISLPVCKYMCKLLRACFPNSPYTVKELQEGLQTDYAEWRTLLQDVGYQ
jgi:hypothetical protein